MAQAKALRQNLTPEELIIWKHLRAHRFQGIGFRRQHAIGPYVVDFCAPRQKLIIELDGSQHLDQQEYDAERNAYLEGLGYRIIRFWNRSVVNELEEVLDRILKAIRR